MQTLQSLADALLPALRAFVTSQKLHPVLVNFTAALVPVSVGTDVAARILKKESLRATAWWTLFVAACITPFTAVAGWLFWMDDDNGVAAMTIHKWLGTTLAILLVGLVLWRWRAFRRDRWPSVAYLLIGGVVVGALVYQGRLGGDQSFGGTDSPKSSDAAVEKSSGNSASMPAMPGMNGPRMSMGNNAESPATKPAPTTATLPSPSQ